MTAMPVALEALAIFLATVVPDRLSAAPRLRHTPRSALVLWQAVALSAVLAGLGAAAAVVTGGVLEAPRTIVDGLVAAVAVLVAAVIATRLLVAGHCVGRDLRRQRRRHGSYVDLLARQHGGVRVIDHPVPVAYCLPGATRNRIVVTEATFDALTVEELEAVLAHERSHLRWRHDLVVEAFTVLQRAFPHSRCAQEARREVGLLTEVLADRAAVAVAGRRALVSALLQLSPARPPSGAMAAGGGQVAARVDLLVHPRSLPGQAAAVIIGAAILVALPVLLVVAPLLSGSVA